MHGFSDLDKPANLLKELLDTGKIFGGAKVFVASVTRNLFALMIQHLRSNFAKIGASKFFDLKDNKNTMVSNNGNDQI